MRGQRVEFRYTSLRWVSVRFPYDENLINELKALVNPLAWDKASKLWIFPETFLPHVDALMKRHVPEYTGGFAAADGHSKLDINTPWRSSDHYKVLCLNDAAPEGLVEVAYRFWRREFAGNGTGTAEPLMAAENAYSALTGKPA